MLPLKHRLKKKKDFEKVLKEGSFFRTNHLFLKIKKNEINISRIGFIISKKKIKKAVERNRVKRKLREIIRFYLSKIKPGYDMVFGVMSEAEGKEYQELEKTVIQILKKAKITNDQ